MLPRQAVLRKLWLYALSEIARKHRSVALFLWAFQLSKNGRQDNFGHLSPLTISATFRLSVSSLTRGRGHSRSVMLNSVSWDWSGVQIYDFSFSRIHHCFLRMRSSDIPRRKVGKQRRETHSRNSTHGCANPLTLSGQRTPLMAMTVCPCWSTLHRNNGRTRITWSQRGRNVDSFQYDLKTYLCPYFLW